MLVTVFRYRPGSNLGNRGEEVCVFVTVSCLVLLSLVVFVFQGHVWWTVFEKWGARETAEVLLLV